MHESFERAHEYDRALDGLRFSDEAKDRMVQSLLEAEQPAAKRPRRRPLRTALAAAAACLALAATAAAAAPGIRDALQAGQGIFAPYAQDIQNAVCMDQGIEIQVVSALADDVRGWVYYAVRDTQEDRLDGQLTVKGSMKVKTDEPRDATMWINSPEELEYDQLISYDPDTKTALFAKNIWFGNDFEPVEDAHFSANLLTMREGRFQDSKADCSSVTGETLESLPVAAGSNVIFSPGGVEGAPYGDEVLPDEQVVLAPGQNRAAISGTEGDIWVSSMGIASDGCFHVRLEFAQGVQGAQDLNAAAFPQNMDSYTEAHFTVLARNVENGLDILFPMLHAGDVEELDYIWFGGSYTRPGAEIAGGWSMDFTFAYHESTVLDWTGEIREHQVTQVTVSPLCITMNLRGESDISAQLDAHAQLRDGSTVGARPSTGSHLNGEQGWEIYSTWEFLEPVDVEEIVSLQVMGAAIPVNP